MKLPVIQGYFLVLLLGGSLLLSFFIFQPFIIPLVLAAICATTLYPLYTRILGITKDHKSFSAFVTLSIGILCVVIPLLSVGSKVVEQAQHTYATLSTHSTHSGEVTLEDTIIRAGSSLEGIVPGATTIARNTSLQAKTYVSEGLSFILKHAGGAFSGILSFGLSLFIFLFALYFFLRDGVEICKKLIQISPFSDIHDTHILSRLARTTNSVVRGTLTVALIQGVLATVGFLIFGLPNSVLWGTLTSFAALVPGIGTSLVLIPSVIYVFATGTILQGIGLSVWAVLAVSMVDNVIGPKLMGKGIEIHQLAMMLSVLGGLAFFGPAGIFLGPLCISLVQVLFSIYTDTLK
jgi:predicted PurR-regulated permease PerM